MSNEAAGGEAPPAYRDLLEAYRRVVNLRATERLLNWDQEVMMPDGGTAARAEQLSTLSSIGHDLLTDPAVGERLEALEAADLDPERRAVVREVGREHDRAVAVPRDLVEELSRTAAEAHPVWREARENDDFAAFEGTLERLVELRRDYAAHIDPDREPYAVLFEDYEPYLPLADAERVLGRLRDELVPLLETIEASPVELPDPVSGTFDVADQEALCRDVLDRLGYDWDRGRLDVAPHPFSTGTQFDARITTRFDEADLLSSISSTVHEFGHANYTLGLPGDRYGSPLGQSRNMTVHESQSRFWENHVGRSRAFWEGLLPTVVERFPSLSGTDPAALYASANRVYPDNLIRVEADELTYHLHIVLRFEIERDLITGDLEVSEVPAVWGDKSEAYLGVRPGTDADGCLQDIHWSHGSFGYFPTYSLGSVLAAQVDASVRAAVPAVEEDIRAGEFGPIRDWLAENVHRHGCRYTTPELIEVATGEAFTADHFLGYVNGKFGDLYAL